jgi:hypothetical protein
MKQTSVGESLGELSKPGPHSITLQFDSDSPAREADAFLHYLIDSGVSPQSSWDMVIGGIGGCKGNITLLSEAIRVLPQINALHWITPSPIPPVILRSLEASHPNCSLYYELDFWSGSGRNHQNWFSDSVPINETTNSKYVETLNGKNSVAARRHIINASNLYSLKSPIVYGYQSTSSYMDLVFDILTSCPNIRELDLSINDYGCEFSNQAPYSFNFQRINTTLRPFPLPPLEVLKLDGYMFETRPMEKSGAYFMVGKRLKCTVGRGTNSEYPSPTGLAMAGSSRWVVPGPVGPNFPLMTRTWRRTILTHGFKQWTGPTSTPSLSTGQPQTLFENWVVTPYPVSQMLLSKQPTRSR